MPAASGAAPGVGDAREVKMNNDNYCQPSGRKLSSAEAAAYLGLAEGTMRKLRVQGTGPAFLRISSRRIVYDVRDLEAFAIAGKRTSTSDTGAKPVACAM